MSAMSARYFGSEGSAGHDLDHRICHITCDARLALSVYLHARTTFIGGWQGELVLI